MNLSEWMQEVRRLRLALDMRAVRVQEAVTLEHCPAKPRGPHDSRSQMTWRASHAGASVDGETPESAMRGLLEHFRSRLAEAIAERRSELAELERVQGAALRLVKDGPP